MPIRLKDEWYDKADEKYKGWDFCDEHGWSQKTHEGLARKVMAGLFKEPWAKQMNEELKRLSELWSSK